MFMQKGTKTPEIDLRAIFISPVRNSASLDADNPFVSEDVAREWIASVEGESGLWRDKILYPAMRLWLGSFSGEHPVVADVGSGQGRAATELSGYGAYIGIEPSPFLTERAQEMYAAEDRHYFIGNAYDVPLADGSIDAVISVNVLFHLADVERAIGEIARILKVGGRFFINTADNDAVETWKTIYSNLEIDEKKMQGTAHVPVNALTLNTFYFQPNDQVMKIMERNGLKVDEVTKSCEKDGQTLFLTLQGRKV